MLVRVFEIPAPTGKFHFGGGEPQVFIEVDWFRDDDGLMEPPEGRIRAEKFIRDKRYFDPTKAYLILHPVHPATIGYDPDAMRRAALEGEDD